ncbi:hypothetical protein HYH02_011210 [Chlamydomonas schloesseri]|uniref:Pyrrolo-quinoline quinone repeat domain-containing protein n=1 Tax=Chlamydomonas schloesseri TaxID=2026947 RepID=A0A835T7B3_9CHLO|nr:hypothetical protein HYH02_011210 [Chlamydomonas schloesseri]|eukprot:KAG2437568.1 hypothetical protein HYH02_011210 [Chlamydomonas schloesseri]
MVKSLGRTHGSTPLLIAVVLVIVTAVSCEYTTSWGSFGGTFGNAGNRNWRLAHIAGPFKRSAQPAFKVDTGAQDVSCTPTVIAGHVFFGDWAGYLHKVDAATGKVAWSLNVTELVWPKGAGATNLLQTRTSPTDDGAGNLIIGTQTRVLPGNPDGVQGYVLSIKASDGSVNWRAIPDPHPFAVITSSPTVYKGAVYTGVSSLEELVAGIGLECCSFRGSVVKLDLKTGAKLWQFFTAPENGGKPGSWSGNAVWGSAPTIVEKHGLVVVATGNGYEVSKEVEQCLDAAKTPQEKGACVHVPGNWFNSVLGIYMANGSLAWGSRVDFYDVWTAACIPLDPAIADCAVKESPDYDFGQAPMYFPNTKCGSETRDILVAAQKSGWAYGFDARTGKMLWSKSAGPGSTSGGSQWGSASDGKSTVFLQNSNFAFLNHTLVNPAPGSAPVAGGGFGTAIDVCTGSIKWQSAMPITPATSSSTMGPPTYVQAKGGEFVVYPTMSPEGKLVVLNAATGAVWTTLVAGNGSIVSGPSVANGMLYVGVGYRRFGFGAGTTKYGLAAFKLY